MLKSEVAQILIQEDIIPLGTFESRPVTSARGGEAWQYPNVVRLKPVENFSPLYAEAKEHVSIVGSRYIRERIEHFDQRVPIEDLKKYLADVGFYKEVYQSFSLRKLGTNELEDFVLPATRQLFATLGVETFRQQYTVSTRGWKTKLHRDHVNFNTHGFRGMVPVHAPVYLGYVGEQGENLIYRLDPGYVYFANIAQPHRGFSFEDDRINMMFQMCSDALIVDPRAEELKPLSDLSGIPSAMIDYENVDLSK